MKAGRRKTKRKSRKLEPGIQGQEETAMPGGIFSFSGFRLPISAFYLLIVGFISLLGQVVILRELNIAFYGVELVYVLAMGIWLLWTGIGALIGRRNYTPSVRVIKFLLAIFAILLPAELAFIRGSRLLFGGVPGGYLPFGQQLVVVIISLLPVGILLGLLFQWTAKLYIREGKNLALAYAVESAGALMGGLASTLLLHFGVQNFTITILCGVVAVLSSFSRETPKDEAGLPGDEYFKSAVFFILMFIFFSSGKADHFMTRWNHPHLVDTCDSPYSRLTISGRQGQLSVFENNALAFETQGTSAEEFVHLAAIQHPKPDRVLVAGGGTEGIVREILKHAPLKVDYVELNAVLLDLAKKHLPSDYKESLDASAVRVRHADPRKFLEDAGTYDLILVGMPDPASGQSNRFYTREYFRECSDKLTPDGVLAFRLRSAENLWSRFLTYRNASICNALASVFRDVLVLPGVTSTVIASDAPLIRDSARLIERFEQRKIRPKLVTPAYINYLYTNDRFYEIANRISSTKALPNTDTRPVCYQYSGMIWLSKFIPGMIHKDISFSDLSDRARMMMCAVVICPVLLFLLARGRPGMRSVLLAGLAGFIGMILETMLMLYYQVKHGVLFQNIGILLMMFMAGLAAGSVAMGKAAEIRGREFEAISGWLGKGLLAGFGILSLIFIALLRYDYESGIIVISLLQFLTGFLVSGVFSFASLLGAEDQETVVSPLYAADLFGGCIGSLLGSLVFIPFLGMEQSAVMAALLGVAALIAI
ncbi:hypothetical protein QUF80_01885 [Desulfococcaceae bacterium HSG8]|nr:hypothetical protein [Desulfococcaceae bacterium HSG8]